MALTAWCVCNQCCCHQGQSPNCHIPCIGSMSDECIVPFSLDLLCQLEASSPALQAEQTKVCQAPLQLKDASSLFAHCSGLALHLGPASRCSCAPTIVFLLMIFAHGSLGTISCWAHASTLEGLLAPPSSTLPQSCHLGLTWRAPSSSVSSLACTHQAINP